MYFNKAAIELSAGLYEQAINTCKLYIKPVKMAFAELLTKKDGLVYKKSLTIASPTLMTEKSIDSISLLVEDT